MQTLISQAIEETLEEALGHDPEYHLYRNAIHRRLEEALARPKVTKQSTRGKNKAA